MEEEYSKIKLIYASDIMSENVVVIKESMLIGQVAHLMLRERVSAYPVVDENENLVGIVTLTDLYALLEKLFRGTDGTLSDRIANVKKLPVKDLMTRKVKSVTPDTSLDKIIKDVVELRIHSFPVMEQKRLVGIIGRHDLLNAAFVYA